MLLKFMYQLVNHDDTVTLQSVKENFIDSDQYYEDGLFPDDILNKYVVLQITTLDYQIVFTVKEV